MRRSPRLADYLAHAFLLWVRDGLRTLPPYPPRSLDLRLIREDNNMLIYKLTFNPTPEADVVGVEFTESVNGGPPAPKSGDLDMELSYNDGDQVTLADVVLIDDAGNRSSPPAGPFDFTAADTLPPLAPTGFGVTLVREEPDAAPPEPAPEA